MDLSHSTHNNVLKMLEKAGRNAKQQPVTVVQRQRDECMNNCHHGFSWQCLCDRSELLSLAIHQTQCWHVLFACAEQTDF